jgi:AcrR family transcriptional regulator
LEDQNTERIKGRETKLYKKVAYLFNKFGYSGTSMRQIGRENRIRGSSLYHYIRRKEDLLLNICERSMLQSLEAIGPIVRSNLRCDLKLQKMIEVHIITIAKNANEHSTMLKELRSLGINSQRKIIKLRDYYETLFRNVIADGAKEGFFRRVNAKISTLALLGMMNWLIHWYSPNGQMESEEIARIFSELFIEGLKSAEIHG